MWSQLPLIKVSRANITDDTMSVCPCRVLRKSCEPTFHSLIVRSSAPEASVCPSGEKATPRTPPV